LVGNGGRDTLTRVPSGFRRYDILAGVIFLSFVADEING
jgi:hypothetical protein